MISLYIKCGKMSVRMSVTVACQLSGK